MLNRLLWICSEPPESGLPSWTALLNVERASNVFEALEMLRHGSFGAILASLPLLDWTAEEVLEELHRSCPGIPVMIQDAGMGASQAVRLARLGAYECLDGSASEEQILASLDLALEQGRLRRTSLLRSERAEPWKQFLVGDSKAMQDVESVIRLVGPRRCTVLLTGETGTGKEMAARALHLASPRGRLPMVSVNCSALPANLLEAELFGHVKGAFTGAIQQRIGRFEQAHKSTLFLDEVGDLPLELQAKLLRVLQERELQRLGSSETIKVDVRIIAATNVDLLQRVREGKFREDLYYRLKVVQIQLPSLRDRADDIPLLVQHFIEKICKLEDIPLKEINRETLRRLQMHSWPGNVRELENAVETAIAMSGERTMLLPGDFPFKAPSHGKVIPIRRSECAIPESGLDLEHAVATLERTLMQQALEKANGNKTVAASLLGLKRTTLLAKLRTLEASGFVLCERTA